MLFYFLLYGDWKRLGQMYLSLQSSIFKLKIFKMKFSMKDFFNRCDQIRGKLQIWSHILKKSLMENSIFCEV